MEKQINKRYNISIERRFYWNKILFACIMNVWEIKTIRKMLNNSNLTADMDTVWENGRIQTLLEGNKFQIVDLIKCFVTPAAVIQLDLDK